MIKNNAVQYFKLKVFWALFFTLTIFLGIIYIFQINSLTQYAFFNQDYEKKIRVLRQENEALKIDFSRAGSLAKIENYFYNQSFEKVKQVKYIQLHKPVAKVPGFSQ